MTVYEKAVAVAAGLLVLQQFGIRLWRLLRQISWVHAVILGDGKMERKSLDERLNDIEKRLIPNGGSSLADGLSRLEAKLDTIAQDVSDQHQSLTIHVATSDLEQANLRHALAQLREERDAVRKP